MLPGYLSPAVAPDGAWTEPEKWVWEQVCKGERADFNARYAVTPADLAPDPRNAAGWSANRLLSSAFLELILLHAPYRDALPRHGVRIIGAWIKDKLDLSNARLAVEWWLDKSRFEEEVDLSRLQASDIISLEGSFFAKNLNLNYFLSKDRVILKSIGIADKLSLIAAIIEKDLRMDNGLECGEIDMRNARIGMELRLSGARVRGRVNMDGMVARSDVYLGDAAEYTEISMLSSDLGGQVFFMKAKVSKTWDATGLLAKTDLFLDETEFATIYMTGAEIGGQLHMEKVKVSVAASLSAATIRQDMFMEESAFASLDMSGCVPGGQLRMGDVKIAGLLDMNAIQVKQDLFLNNSELSEVDMAGAVIGGELWLSAAKVTGKLRMVDIVIGGKVYMDEGASFQEINIFGGQIGGSLILERLRVQGDLNMRSIVVKRGIRFGAGGVFAAIRLPSAQVYENLDFYGAVVEGELLLDKIAVSGTLYFRLQSIFSEVRMIGGKIGNSFELTGLRVEKDTNIQSISVGQNVIFRQGVFGGDVRFIDSSINVGFMSSGCTFSYLDLSGIKIQGELQLGELDVANDWTGASFVNLRNAQVGALSDAGKDSWPANLDLDGFACASLGSGLRDGANCSTLGREASWLVWWLRKDNPYSTQPYIQLAGALSRAGYGDTANSILYASRDREREMAWTDKHFTKWLGLSLLNWTIGYGYGSRYFRSLIWVAALTAIGVLVIGTVHTGVMRGASLSDRIGFSLDMLLPVIQLNEKYKIDFQGWQQIYFYLHKIMGFVLGSFVAAGLAGITKK